MSGLLAVFRRDGGAVDPAVVDRIAGRLAHRGPDGCRLEVSGPMALGHLHFWVTEEEVGEEQPLRGSTTSLRLVFDGRLDNREELAGSLGLSRAATREISDGALVLAAFERWGEGCLDRLLGPMALIVYDPASHRVVLVRDPVGNRGLYYHLSSRLLVVASEPWAVLAHPEVRDDLDEERIAQFFASRLDDHRTFFSAVSAVSPGHALVVEAAGVRDLRFWRFRLDSGIHDGAAEENSERFLDLLGEAVQCRLRGRGQPSLMLSGGLDSTSIAALCLRSGTPLGGLTWSFDELESCDERAFIELLNRSSPLPSLLSTEAIPGDDAWPLADPSTWPVNPNTPEENAYRRLHERCFAKVRENGGQVALNGMFGDQLFLGTEGWLFDLIRRGQLREAIRGSAAEAREAGVKAFLRRSIASPLLDRYRNLRGKGSLQAPPWLTLFARSKLAQREVVSPVESPRPGQYEAVLGLINAHGVATEGWHMHHQKVEVRFPYRDRRLIELALSLPTERLFSPGRRRPIVRDAMRGLLPEEIRLRQNKTSFAPLFRRGIEDRQKDFVVELLEGPSRRWDTYVDRSWLFSSTLGEAPWPEGRLLVLWLCICFELWQGGRRCDGKPGEPVTTDPRLRHGVRPGGGVSGLESVVKDQRLDLAANRAAGKHRCVDVQVEASGLEVGELGR